MADPIRAALGRLVAASRYPGLVVALEYQQAREAARAALAATPTPPADGEAEELAQWLEREADCAAKHSMTNIDSPEDLRRAAALLREARPQSVPVAERPWEREGWCDSVGRCWWLVLNQSWPCLYLMKPNSALTANTANRSLPHWAILIPTEPTTTETPNG